MNKKALLGLMLGIFFYNYGFDAARRDSRDLSKSFKNLSDIKSALDAHSEELKALIDKTQRELVDDSAKIRRELTLKRSICVIPDTCDTPDIIDKRLVQTYMGILGIKEVAKSICGSVLPLDDFAHLEGKTVKQGVYLYSYSSPSQQHLLTPWGLVNLWPCDRPVGETELNNLRGQLTLEFVRNEGEEAGGVSSDIFYVKDKKGIHQKSIAELEKYRGKNKRIFTQPPDDFPSIYKITAVKRKPLPDPQEFLPGDGRSEIVRSCEWRLLNIFFGQKMIDGK